ncbi:MAG: hypothetical protein RLZZ26_15 [Candidatus Parcubacteria bacterium]|jgi:subtilase family serine protease
MHKKTLLIIVVGLLASFGPSALADRGINSSEPSDQRQGHLNDLFNTVRNVHHSRVCADAVEGGAACDVRVVTDAGNIPLTNTLPSGLSPANLHAAYGSQTAVSGRKVLAIVDAYDDPNIIADLAKYSSTFGISSLPTCTVAVASSPTPCFQKVDQRGGTRYPAVNSGWALEVALDVESAHAMCQNCSILLVEADSSSYSNLLTAEDRAATLGANAISNSWGGGEFSSETSSSYDGHFNKPGISITASAGDNGYGVEYPAASRYVTAVGGTSLVFNPDGSYGGEAAWLGTGSGCSAYEPKPTWQTNGSCARRTVSDVSAVADPATGAAVYDSVRYSGQSGWFQVGGTSLASPIIAASYLLGGGSLSPQLPYSQGSSTSLHDVVSGSNGSCGGSLLCTALVGYDGPTGLGTPNGFAAF